jgi:hypothetical protein
MTGTIYFAEDILPGDIIQCPSHIELANRRTIMLVTEVGHNPPDDVIARVVIRGTNTYFEAYPEDRVLVLRKVDCDE